MEIVEATYHKELVMALLKAEKLPVSDLPATLENFLVALQNNQVIGVVGLEIYGHYGLLRSLAVLPKQRNTGIAGKLLGWIEALAVSRGLTDICLLTETARDYFMKKGYVQIARAEVPAEVQQSSEFSYVCPQSAMVMRKILNNSI